MIVLKNRTYLYELNNNTWNTIEWDVDNGYINEEGFKMNQHIQTYIKQSCLFLRMAGTGKSNILRTRNAKNFIKG